LRDKFGAKDQVIMVENVEDPEGPMIEKTIEGQIYYSEVKELLLKKYGFLTSKDLLWKFALLDFALYGFMQRNLMTLMLKRMNN
jgi:hypothetical protein